MSDKLRGVVERLAIFDAADGSWDKFVRENAEKIAQWNKEGDEREVVWLRHILALAAGALAILAGLGPDVPSGSLAQYFLAATWASLGVGIASGAAATYIAINQAKQTAELLYENLVRSLQEDDRELTLISRLPNRWLQMCKPAMIVSLLAAVLCLAAYAIITTLGF